MLVPDTPTLATSVIDVRDLVGWLLDRSPCHVRSAVTGDRWRRRRRAGCSGEASNEYMGPESMAMWLVEAGTEGWSARSGAAALAAGLRHRPRTALLADLLIWERDQGMDRARPAGLSSQREHDLLAALSENAN